MSPLEQLFALEVEFQRKVRAAVLGDADTAALHTSYALQSGYESLLRGVNRVTLADIDRLAERSSLVDDPRDVLHARDSLTRLLGVDPFQG